MSKRKKLQKRCDLLALQLEVLELEQHIAEVKAKREQAWGFCSPTKRKEKGCSQHS